MTVPTNNKEREALAKLVIDMMPNVPLCCSGAAFKFEGHDQNPPCLTVIRGREIADVILAARRRNRSGDNTLPYISISETPVMYSPEAMHAYANGYNTALESASRPREVRTVEELDALPQYSLIQEYDGFKRIKWQTGKWLLCIPRGAISESAEIELPARILFTPSTPNQQGAAK